MTGSVGVPVLVTDFVAFVEGIDYRELLVRPLRKQGITVEVPLEGLSIGRQLKWFKKLRDEQKRLSHLDQFYQLLDKLEKGVGGRRMLRQCTGEMDWSKMGVYFFFAQEAPDITTVLLYVFPYSSHPPQ